jgi:hypothetical protein
MTFQVMLFGYFFLWVVSRVVLNILPFRQKFVVDLIAAGR